MTVAAVIVAGGSGFRAGGELPKQYQMIGGKPMLWWTVRAFAKHPGISLVQPVIGDGHQQMFEEAMGNLKVAEPVVGGLTRQESCRAGLEAITAKKPSKVLIHDGARPFASQDLISHVIAWLDHYRAVVPGLPVAETLKLAPGGIVKSTIDRAGMWTAQTPQGFSFDDIVRAHRSAFEAGAGNFTDDAAVAERAGIEISMIPGRVDNRKITTAEDVDVADRKLRQDLLAGLPEVRVGQGIDVHPFAEGDSVMLCGVKIPHSAKLAGHSDADVALHALTDALFGALGEGDIGIHFPPSEAKWKGANSSIFVKKAVESVRFRGGIIANVDITILAEAPRIGKHIPAMKSCLAALLGIDAQRIAIKATTTERLGAIGRGEGIAAFATATIRLP